MRQLRWWASLTETERAERRAARRRQLDAMSSEDRQAWLDWLGRRELIDAAIRHLLDGTDRPHDHEVIATAPMTVHHGRRDPAWRTGGTPRPLRCQPARPVQTELTLFTAPPVASTSTRSGRGRRRRP